MTKLKYYPFMQFFPEIHTPFPDEEIIKYANHQNRQYNEKMLAFGKYAQTKEYNFPFFLNPTVRDLYVEWDKTYDQYEKIEINHYFK